MGTNTKLLTLTDLRGGMNDTDPPLLVGDRQVVDAVNVEYLAGGLGQKRGGTAVIPVTFSDAGVMDDKLVNLVRYVPAADENNAELFAGWGTHVGRRAAAATWTEVTPTDAPIADLMNTWVGASFDSKLFLAYDTTQNRLHCWDGTSLRRVGLATPAAPTAADSGSGAYAATIRYYKVSYAEKSGTTVVRRSELSPVLTKTPSGSGTGLTITKPAAITEGETHWELWGSEDNLTFYFIAATVVGTTTYVDSAAPSSYSAGAVEPVVNSNLPPPSAKYVVTDGNRLIMAGAWETSGGYVSPKSSRVWFTPVMGALDIGDSERIPSDHYVDVDENDGSFITGLAVFDGAVWVFKLRSMWKLIPTGNSSVPYQVVLVSRHIGAVNHQSIVQAVDENGTPALYFLSANGPMRVGTGGIARIGYDWDTTWRTYDFYVLYLRTTSHAIYYPDKHQIWWWITNGTAAGLDKVLFVLDVTRQRGGEMGFRGGWSRYTGDLANATCSVCTAASGTTPSLSMRPTIGRSYGSGVIWSLDTGTLDGSTTAFQAYITTKPYALGGIGRNFGLGAGQLVARASAGTTITVTASQDYGLETRTSTVSLSPEASETSVVRKLEGMDGAGLNAVQFTIGDDAASASAWTLDALVVPYDVEEPR